MQLAPEVSVADGDLVAFCVAHGIQRLRLFGSALRGELRPDSDIDILVEFEPGRAPGLLGLAALELELEAILGREVELRTPSDLSPYFRDSVTESSRLLYAA
jgi:predicted nucleotidyltransferase